MRILLVHADLRLRGGAEDYARRIEKLLRKAGHKIGRLDINGHVDPSGRQLQIWWHRPFQTLPVLRDLILLKYAAVCRATPIIARQYDRIVFTFGEGPAVAGNTIQMRHAPALFKCDRHLLAFLGTDISSTPKVVLRFAYNAVCRVIAKYGADWERCPSVIANSNWTKREILARCGPTKISVVYPKVTPFASDSAVARNPMSVVAIGRIVPNKRLEEAIEIVEQLNAQGFPVKLQILGRVSGKYARHLMNGMQRKHFVSFTPDASCEQISRALAEATYGLHCYRHEHFGIAVAEMISAGCIPLVFNGGGVTELVVDSRLRFGSTEDAISKFVRLLQLLPSERNEFQASLPKSEAFGRACNFEGRMADVFSLLLLPELTVCPTT